MKSIVLTGIRAMEMVDVPMPMIKAKTDVLLKVEAIGICGSDVHYYTTGRIGSQIVKYPFRVGHECSATVVETGSGVKELKIGDPVAVDPAASCGTCDQCLCGRFHTCRNLTFLGTPGQGEGCLCEYIVMPEASCFVVSKSMTIEQAAFIEPLSIGVYSAGFGAPLNGKKIGILGSGPIGLSILLASQAQGVGSVYMTDKIDKRLEAATNAGASWTGNPDKDDIVAEISQHAPLLLDVVFECCGQQEALDQAVQLLKPGGKLVLVGIPEVDRVSFVIDQMRRSEICIQNIRRQNECVQQAIDLLESGQVNIDFMITHHFPLEQTKAAFDMVDNYKDGVVKVMINL